MSRSDTPDGMAAASDNPASRKLSGPIEAALTELIGVALEAVGTHDPRLVEALAAVRAAVAREVLPAEMTPEIREVLGLMNFRTGPLVHLFRAAGADILAKCEDEQAFVLFRFLHLALKHGAGWHAASVADVQETLAGAKARMPAEARS